MSRVAGITIERNFTGKPMYARIDLKKHGNELLPFLVSKGISIENIPLSSKLKRSMKEFENGEYTICDTSNFWK